MHHPLMNFKRKRKIKKDVELVDDEYKEDFGIEKNVLKLICKVTKEPVWYYCLLIGVSWCFLQTFVQAIQAIKYTDVTIEPKSAFFIILELFWIIDGILFVIEEYIEYGRPSLLCIALFCNIIISVLPIEIFFSNPTSYYLAGLNRILRIVNVVYIFQTINAAALSWKLCSKFMQIVFLMVYFILLLSFVDSTSYSEFKIAEQDKVTQYIIQTFYSCNKYVTMRGVGQRYFNTRVYINIFFVIASIMIFLFIFCLYTALVTFIFCIEREQITKFRYEYESVNVYMALKCKDKDFVAQVNSYFEDIWIDCTGYHGYIGETRIEHYLLELEDLLPHSYKIKIQINTCLAALKHSILFEDMDMAFLREVACIVKQQKFINKQYIYHRNEMKNKMIYISSGVVQVISEEDAETGIFSLTSGTILGETSLIIPYKCSTSVQCLTKCTVQILERNELLKLAIKYPSYYHIIHKKVLDRYLSTRHLHDVKNLLYHEKNFLFPRCLSELWINYTLHKALAKKYPENVKKHRIDNIYIRDYVNKNAFRNSLFTAKYLRLYSLAERDRIDADSLFAKQTFPFALLPDTGLILFWEIFICVMAIAANIHIPYIILYSTEAVIFSTIYFYTCLWSFDLLIQLRIAVKFKNHISINKWDILTVRIQDPIFIIDFFSCFPLEFCYGLLVFSRLKAVHYNRMLKIVRVYRLLRKWEARFDNFSPIIIRIIIFTVLLFYACFIITCLYSYFKCTQECTEKDVYYLLLYSLQVVISASLNLPTDSYVETYPLLNSIVYVLVCAALVFAYSYLFTTFAFKNVYYHTICYRSFYMKRIINNKTLIETLNSIIQTEFEATNGLNFYSPGHIYKSIPKPLVGYFFKTTYLDWLIELPMFYGIPSFIVLDILQSTAYIKTFPPQNNIYFVGDLMEDLYILAEGSCLKGCGVSKAINIIKPKAALNDLEIFFEIPCRFSIRSVTHCEIIIIRFIEMKRILKECAEVYSIDHSMDAMGNLKRDLLKIETREINIKMKNIKKVSIVENIIFKSTRMQSLLMKNTFIPHGKIVLILEYVRCASAIISALLYTTSFLTLLPFYHMTRILMTMLDLTAFIDLYIRLHVCYYNENGILITHPHLTSKHYLKTSFLVDFISYLPTHFFVNNPKYIFFNMNHVLQMYRYIGFIQYNAENNNPKVSKFFVLVFLPIFIIFLNIFSSIYVAISCDFDLTEVDSYVVNCDKDSIFISNNLMETMTPKDCHFYAWYMTATSITAICFKGFEIVSNISIIFAGVYSIIGFFCTALLVSITFRSFLFDFHSVILFDEGKCVLYHYMDKWKVNVQLKRRVTNYLSRNIVYRKMYIEQALALFGNHFARDYYYCKFSAELVKNCLIESTDFEPFIRNILLHSQYPILLKGGVVYKFNDVIDETIILYTGIVVLMSPNNEVCISLNSGSIIGNLCYLYYNRMFTSVTALSNVELISVKTSKFFEILQHFPNTEREFRKLKNIHIDHIPGYLTRDDDSLLMNAKITFWNSKNGSILTTIFLLIGSYFSQVIYFYQITVAEFSIAIILISATTDMCYIASIIFERIAEQLSNKSNFEKDFFITYNHRFASLFWYLSLFGAVPFDYFIYTITMEAETFYYWFIVCKCNVLLRNFHLYVYCNRMEIVTRLVKAKLLIMQLTTTLVVYVCTALLLVPSDLSKNNLNYHITRKKFAEMTSFQRYYNYLMWLDPITSSIVHLKQTITPTSITYAVILAIIALSVKYYASFLYASIIALFFAKHSLQWNYIAKIKTLQYYLFQTGISSTILTHISDYNELKWKRDITLQFKNILTVLPIDLKEALRSFYVGCIVENHILFKECHPDFSRQLYLKMKFELYQCGDYIQYKGIADECMYWIVYGTVVIAKEISENNEDVIGNYKEGDCFGFCQGILHGMPHLFSYRTTSETYLIILKRSKWDYLLPFFPATRETIYKRAWAAYHKDKNEIANKA